MTRAILILLMLLAIALMLQGNASAHPQYQKAFVKKYIADHPDAEFAKMVKKDAKCWVCHQGKKKVNVNAYGHEFMELLTKDDVKNNKKIDEALETVAARHSNADNETSPTYAELITQSKLPGGPLEDSKKEPDGGGGGDDGGDDDDDGDGDEPEDSAVAGGLATVPR